MKPILFLTSGTRGDVQPIAALARGVQDAGRVVRVAAPPAYQELVESQSVPFAPLEGNPSDLLTQPGAQSALTFPRNPFNGIRSTLAYLQAARPVYAHMITNGQKVSKDARALVVGLPTIWGTSIAEAQNIPCIGAFLQPLTPTGEFPSPIFPSTLRLGRAYNQFTYRLSTLAVFLPWRGVINSWRTQSLGLKSLPPFINRFGRMEAVLYGFSELVVPKPGDWPTPDSDSTREPVFITGYWRMKTQLLRQPSSLAEFIRSGPAPTYVGFGSPGLHEANRLIDLLIRAIREAGLRAVFDVPNHVKWPAQEENIFFLQEKVSHEWLFSQMSGCIHHGGAGTTSTALVAGIPSLITPLAVDQYFWGERIHSLGVGPRAIPQIDLSVEKLVKALKQMREEKMRDAAKTLGMKLRQEDGIANAVQALDKILAAQRENDQW